MTDTTSTDEILRSIDTKLSALLALTAYGLQDSTDPAYPSLDLLLSDNGLNNSDIGKILGKTTGAARKQIDRDRKKR